MSHESFCSIVRMILQQFLSQGWKHFHRKTEPVIDYYTKKGVDANKLSKDVSAGDEKVLSS
ncbi:hypothetical protein FRX31_012861 [Thalictrum thalictroides]|uniref:Uncharacterized protein n=1 Tax=Thalictrum thalictroides TaxID=46969 RepID=A0A7J6WKS3_THATH|nr:hypothetical protein FRX31_012861 [Thalictrum thalictroides]